jgi:hypothetical protein
MRNVEYVISGRKLVITVDLDAVPVPSKSGKTLSIATTGVFVSIDPSDGLAFSLQVCRPVEALLQDELARLRKLHRLDEG